MSIRFEIVVFLLFFVKSKRTLVGMQIGTQSRYTDGILNVDGAPAK